MKYRILTDWESVETQLFRDEWLSTLMGSQNKNVFSHPDLIYAWLRTYRDIRNIAPYFLVGGCDEGSLIWPLVIWKNNWKNAFARVLIPVGYSDYDYNEPITDVPRSQIEAAVSEALHYLIVSLPTYVDRVDIPSMRSNSAPSLLSLGFRETASFCPICDLSEFSSGEGFLSTVKSSLRGDIRRQFRRLGEVGDVTFECLTTSNTEEEIEVFLTDLLNHHSKRWPNAYKAPGFHANIVKHGLPSGVVSLSTLSVDGNPISWHLGFQYEGRYYYYMPAFDYEYQKYSPSKLHLYKLVEYAIENTFDIFDHLRGDEVYKSGWTNQVTKLYSYSVDSEGPGASFRRQLNKGLSRVRALTNAFKLS